MTDPALTPGLIVDYTLTSRDAEDINRRRAHAEEQRIKIGGYHDGVIVHVGNRAEAGQVFPLVITRVWTDAALAAVNGQVLLDGNDTLWKTSIRPGHGEGTWAWPECR